VMVAEVFFEGVPQRLVSSQRTRRVPSAHAPGKSGISNQGTTPILSSEIAT
jgi:hypothetical protein